MLKTRARPEEIVAKLRQVNVLVSQGESVAAAIRAVGVTEVACAVTQRWKKGALSTRAPLVFMHSICATERYSYVR